MIRNGQKNGQGRRVLRSRSEWSLRAKPTERSRETRLTHADRIRKPNWKELGVSNAW